MCDTADPPDAEGRLSSELDPQAAAALQAATPVSPGPTWPKPPIWSSGPVRKINSSSSSSAAAADDAEVKHQAAAAADEAETASTTAALSAATLSPQTPLEMAASVVTAVPGISQSQDNNPEQDVAPHRPQHLQQHSLLSQTGRKSSGQQDPAAAAASLAADRWGGVQYDSNAADIDGTLHVFSDAGVSHVEEDLPPAPKQKYVLLDRVPQVVLQRGS